jgi:hypothetical protein
MAFPSSVKLQQQIEVYQFTIYDGISDQLITSRRWGTLTGIAAVGGNPLRHSKCLVEASDIESEINGLTKIGFEPS